VNRELGSTHNAVLCIACDGDGPFVTRWNSVMKAPIRIAVCAALPAMIALPTLAFAYGPGNPPPPMRGVPGPIVGAGLPIFAVGYGVYWLIRRRQKAD